MTDLFAPNLEAIEEARRVEAERFMAELKADALLDEQGHPETELIAPGVSDMTSYRNTLEMGYEVHHDGAWWPTYDHSQYDPSDWPKDSKRFVTGFEPVHKQWARLGVKRYMSPDSMTVKCLVFE